MMFSATFLVWSLEGPRPHDFGLSWREPPATSAAVRRGAGPGPGANNLSDQQDPTSRGEVSQKFLESKLNEFEMKKQMESVWTGI